MSGSMARTRGGDPAASKVFERLWEDDRGQDLVEYVFIIFFVALVVISALQLLGGNVSSKYDQVKDLPNTGPGS